MSERCTISERKRCAWNSVHALTRTANSTGEALRVPKRDMAELGLSCTTGSVEAGRRGSLAPHCC